LEIGCGPGVGLAMCGPGKPWWWPHGNVSYAGWELMGDEVGVRGFGELEAAIMDRLWARGESMKVRDVLGELQPGRELAYNTVLTVMDILYRKGWLRRERDGRAHRYTPTVSREEYGARLMRDALDEAGDPAEALVRFIGRMNTTEAAALRQALQAHERGEAP
jgi:predicted transcriptional regulator